MRMMKSGDACKYLQISAMTLMDWKNKGIIKCKILTPKCILYDVDSVGNLGDAPDRINVVYARVSTHKQSNDLEHQKKLLMDFMIARGVSPDLVFSDVASGMNENRTDLYKLIQLVTEKRVNAVYITYKDRLTRFGFEYFVKLFALFGTDIIVVNKAIETEYQKELSEDLISIIHHFSMKMYSRRRKHLKDIETKIKEMDLMVD